MNELMKINNVNAYIGENGIAYLKLEDVAKGLGITKERWVNQTKETVLDIRWDRLEQYCTELGHPLVGKDGFIPENIFYKLCMKANNETARKFQDLVCDEILPSIRKNGMYAKEELINKILDNPDFGIELFTNLKEEKNRNKQLEQKIVKLEPKAKYYDNILVPNHVFAITHIAVDLGITPRKLNKVLENLRIQYNPKIKYMP